MLGEQGKLRFNLLIAFPSAFNTVFNIILAFKRSTIDAALATLVNIF